MSAILDLTTAADHCLTGNQSARDSQAPSGTSEISGSVNSRKRSLDEGPSLSRSALAVAKVASTPTMNQYKEADLCQCKFRDNNRCVLTRAPYPQGAHIYPFCLMDANWTKQSPRSVQFWDLLNMFWTADHIKRWKQAIFTNKKKPNIGVESCINMLCLSSNAYLYWNKGHFALKPLSLSADEKALGIQFFWQPTYGHNSSDKIGLLTDTISSKGLDEVSLKGLDEIDQDIFLCRKLNNSRVFIRSGDCFTLTTDDPIERPLPNTDLLEMQWILQRIIGMSGAADWVPPKDDSESDSSRLDENHVFDEDFPDSKRVCYGDPHILGSSLQSLDGVFDWIPPPEKTLPLEMPSLDAISEELS